MSKRTRTLVLGAALAAMNLVGLSAVAQAQATNEGKDARRPPPNAKSERPGANTRSHHRSRPLRMPPSSGSWPTSATPSPAGHPPTCLPQRPPSRPGSPAGFSLRLVSWPLLLRSRAGWP
jgi:hypothetical protein